MTENIVTNSPCNCTHLADRIETEVAALERIVASKQDGDPLIPCLAHRVAALRWVLGQMEVPS